MKNLNQGEKIAVWIGIVVILIFFLFIGIFNRGTNQAINTFDDFMTEQDNTQLADGELIIQDITVGGGDEAVSGNTVTVHYVGTLSDGTVFDSSVARGEPFTFTLGVGQVIQGWDQGVAGMREGGIRRLTIPPSLAYGNTPIGSIPANSTLHFEVELLEVN